MSEQESGRTSPDTGREGKRPAKRRRLNSLKALGVRYAGRLRTWRDRGLDVLDAVDIFDPW